MKRKLVYALPLAVAFSTFSIADADDASIKITDPKLHSINYAIESLEYWVGKAKTGDRQRADRLLTDHAKLDVRFGRLPNTGNEQYQYVARRLAELRNQIVSKGNPEGTASQVKQTVSSETKSSTLNKSSEPALDPALDSINRQLESIRQDLPGYKDNERQRSRIRSDLKTLSARYARVPRSNHPSYIAVGKLLDQFQSAMQPQGGPLEMSDQEVSQYVETIRVRYAEQVVLPQARDIMRNRELTSQDVDAFVKKIKDFGEHADRDLPKLRRVVQATGQGKYWLQWIESKALENLKREMEVVKQRVDREIAFGLSTAKNRSELDIEKNNYAFNNEAMRKSNEELFARTLRTIEQAARLEKMLELPPSWSATRIELQDYVATYRAKVRAASTARELPADVGSEQLHQIAVEVLKRKKYGVGKVVKRIVNSKPVPQDRIEHKEFSGRIETVVRKWEQFQVTTVEQEDGKYFVYVNDLAKFSRAPNPTPIGQWILKQRFKSGEIAEDRL